MTRRRWIADAWEGDTAVLTGDHAAHLSRVLRARPGQEFEIAAGDQVRIGRIESISDDRVVFRLAEPVDFAQPTNISVVLSIFKFDRFEWAVEKLTELAVREIYPAIAARTDIRLAAAAGKRVERWRRIALEAAQQSRRSGPPLIRDPIPLTSVAVPQVAHKLVLAETERILSLQGALDSILNPEMPENPSIVLVTGPEGGWTESELEFFESRAWRRASLGSTILRAETAAIAGVAVIASRLAG